MFALALVSATRVYAQQATDSTGVLLLAHGGSPAWNEMVGALAGTVNERRPIEVAFGMADRANIQGAVDRLVRRGVGRIVAVPLFVSSHSSVFESSEFLLGARAEAPADLAKFAAMHHGPAGDMAAHAGHADPNATRPVVSPVPIRVATALDHSPVVADILTARARAISERPESEVVMVVAHGPVGDAENDLWLRDMEILAGTIRQAAPFAGVEVMTVRDDAPPAVRDAATAELRQRVTRSIGEGRRVLIVPLVLAFGGIENGIRKRLEGLDYRMSTQGLLPDDRLSRWVLDSAAP
ncbi:MAG: hypothetical protein IT184_16760 [Acidobacteria bacterium]|nr:hypothetical protein [Acidobacteriota bacterium]